MTLCLFVAAVLILLNACIAGVAWKFLAKPTTRPPFARVSGAVLGAAGGAWITAPEVEYISERACHSLFLHDIVCRLSLVLPMLYSYPFVLPLTAGLSTWLFAEIFGGQSAKPLLSLRWSIVGAVLGAAWAFSTYLFVPGVERVVSDTIAWYILVTVPAAGALLGLGVAERAGRRAS